MGMYTEVVALVKLDHKRPDWVDRTILYFAGCRDDYSDDWSGFGDHPIFKCDRWRYFLGGRQAVYMHGPAPEDGLIEEARCGGVNIDKYGYLRIYASFKNYGNELKLFFDWLAPHVRMTWPEFIGFYRYEEMEDPSLIYWDGVQFVYKYADFSKELWRQVES